MFDSISCACGWSYQLKTGKTVELLIREYLKHNPNSDIIAKKQSLTVEDLRTILNTYDGYIPVKFVLPDFDRPININSVEYRKSIDGLLGYVALSE